MDDMGRVGLDFWDGPRKLEEEFYSQHSMAGGEHPDRPDVFVWDKPSQPNVRFSKLELFVKQLVFFC